MTIFNWKGSKQLAAIPLQIDQEFKISEARRVRVLAHQIRVTMAQSLRSFNLHDTNETDEESLIGANYELSTSTV